MHIPMSNQVRDNTHHPCDHLVDHFSKIPVSLLTIQCICIYPTVQDTVKQTSWRFKTVSLHELCCIPGQHMISYHFSIARNLTINNEGFTQYITTDFEPY